MNRPGFSSDIYWRMELCQDGLISELNPGRFRNLQHPPTPPRHRTANTATGLRQRTQSQPLLPPVHNAWRIRHDHVDKDGKVSFRRAGKMHHLGVGRQHRRTPVTIHADTNQDTVANEHTREVLSQHHINPDKACWRNQLKPVGRWPKKMTPEARLRCHLSPDSSHGGGWGVQVDDIVHICLTT